MFSLDAMTRGQHAVSSAGGSLPSLAVRSACSVDGSRASVRSLGSASTYGACCGPGARAPAKHRSRRSGSSRRRSKSRSSASTADTLTAAAAASAASTGTGGARWSASNEHLTAQPDDDGDGDGDDWGTDEPARGSFSFYHSQEARAASELPLKEAPGGRLAPFEFAGARTGAHFVIRRKGAPGSGGSSSGRASGAGSPAHIAPSPSPSPPGRFRCVVAGLIIVAVALSAYASNTMYIAAIEMISNDVLQAGMTSIRARHLALDPLAASRNAAAPGTCPVDVGASLGLGAGLAGWLALGPSGVGRPMNASEISANERRALASDAIALRASIGERLARGALVDWSIEQRGYMFTAHNIGTILLALPVGRLGLIYGAKQMLFWCILLTCLRMLLFPTLAGYAPFWATFAFESTVGGIGGNIILLGYPISAAWLLPDEANLFVALNILASLIGTSATNFISTQLLAAGLSWCWCYYLPGAVLGLLALVWLVWGADRPESSRFVSGAELALLQSNTIAQRNAAELARLQAEEQEAAAAKERRGQAEGAGAAHRGQGERETLLPCAANKKRFATPTKLSDANNNNNNNKWPCRCGAQRERDACPANKLVRRPNWATILACPTLWALILVALANHWTTKNATLWPTFFSNILHLDSFSIGIMLGVKGVWALLFGTLFALLTRKLVVRRPFGISLTAYRRWGQALAVLVYALSVALVLALDCELWANVLALWLQPLVSGLNSISADQMPLDLSAEDSGLLVSFVRLMSVGDIVALPVASYILSFAPNALAGDRRTWRLVWGLGLGARVLTSALFCLVAKSRPKSYSRLEPAGACKSAAAAGPRL